MSVSLRMTRAGAKGLPFYRIVASDRRSPRDGRFIEQLGIYDPLRDPPEVRLDLDRVDHYIKTGAKPSETVRDLIKVARKAAGSGASASK